MHLPRRKLRRIAKWGGLLLAGILLGVDVASVKWTFFCRPATCDVYLGSGVLNVTWFGQMPSPAQGTPLFTSHRLNHMFWEWGYQSVWVSPEFARRAKISAAGYGGGSWRITLWPFGLALGGVAALLWWSDHRDKGPGYCANCRYDLSGLPADAVCPECAGTRRT